MRTYAKLLGIDLEPILEAYRAMEQQRGVGSAAAELRMLDELSQLVERRVLGEKRPARRGVGRARLVLTLAGLALVLGALAWYRFGARASPPGDSLGDPFCNRSNPVG